MQTIIKSFWFQLAIGLLLEVVIAAAVKGGSSASLWEAFMAVNVAGFMIIVGPLGGINGAPEWALYPAMAAGTFIQLLALMILFKAINQLIATRRIESDH